MKPSSQRPPSLRPALAVIMMVASCAGMAVVIGLLVFSTFTSALSAFVAIVLCLMLTINRMASPPKPTGILIHPVKLASRS